MYFDVKSPAIRFTGRWNVTEKGAVTTAPGSMMEIACSGKMMVLHFNISTNQAPLPHLWIRIDQGAKIEVPLDRYLHIEAPQDGPHMVEIIFKSAVEMQHRWYEPLVGKVTFVGFEADSQAELPADGRKVIEFIGDSITEGVLIDAHFDPGKLDQPNRVYQDDATATYAWLAAEELGMKPVIMGYGAVGMTKSGQGAVPAVGMSYPYCYNNVPCRSFGSDIIVINHGTNDMYADEQHYVSAYTDFLQMIREKNKNALIVVLSPFCGVFDKTLGELVARYNQENEENVLFISSEGWIPRSPIHPNRDSHEIAARNLAKALKPYV